jgi:hypothetical protein
MLVLAMRSHRRHSAPAPPNFDFSLEELHRLHLAGQLSAEEFGRAKAVVLARQDRTQPGPNDASPSSRRGFEVLPPESRHPGA